METPAQFSSAWSQSTLLSNKNELPVTYFSLIKADQKQTNENLTKKRHRNDND